MKYMIVTESPKAIDDMHELMSRIDETCVFVTPKILSHVQACHDFIGNGELTDVAYFVNGVLDCMPNTSNEPGDFTDGFYAEALPVVMANLEPSQQAAALKAVLDIITPAPVPVPTVTPAKEVKSRGKRSGSGDVSEQARAGIIEAVKAGKVPVVRESKEGLRDLLSVEMDIAPDDLSESKRTALRKAMKQICVEFWADGGIPRFKTLAKWATSFDKGETLHDFEDWLTAAKDKFDIK